MESKKKLNTMYRNVFLSGVPLGILQITSILLWIFKGIWWPFVLWVVIAIPFSIFWTRYYYRHTAYICPQCHEIFRPAFKEAFFARHTMKTRKLTCVKCGHHGFCVETWGGDKA
jgi:DNA-directed RNA polymerase subunit RPC12/RpoP